MHTLKEKNRILALLPNVDIWTEAVDDVNATDRDIYGGSLSLEFQANECGTDVLSAFCLCTAGRLHAYVNVWALRKKFHWVESRAKFKLVKLNEM